MATRISTLKPNCAYNPGGITQVRVLDYDDFIAFGFAGSALYDNCLVTAVQRSGDFADVQAKVAKYSGPISGKIINHSLDTFIESLGADMTSAIHLASRRRYIVVFKSYDGKTYAFGYEAGATVSYAGQTDGALGYMLSFNCASIYPLFEIADGALENTLPVATFLPDFINGAYCTI